MQDFWWISDEFQVDIWDIIPLYPPPFPWRLIFHSAQLGGHRGGGKEGWGLDDGGGVENLGGSLLKQVRKRKEQIGEIPWKGPRRRRNPRRARDNFGRPLKDWMAAVSSPEHDDNDDDDDDGDNDDDDDDDLGLCVG